MPSLLALHDLASPHLPVPVLYAVLRPEHAGPLPLCMLLLGAGGMHENLVDLQPIFEECWNERLTLRMIVAVPSPGMDYYLEDSAGTVQCDSFLAAGQPTPHYHDPTAGRDRGVVGCRV